MAIKKLFFSLLFLAFAGCLLSAQDGTSLGEIARRARAEKQNGATNSAPAARSKSTSSVPVNSQPSAAHDAAGQPETRNDSGPIVSVTPEHGAVVKIGSIANEDVNLHYLDHYTASIRQHFEKEEFELLDNLTATARSTKARLPGGFWTIHIIYDPLTHPPQGTYKATDADFSVQIERLKRWVAQRPTSITARVALAGTYLQYAEHARGGGYADTVSDEGWRLESERAEIAAKILVEAFDLPEKCPEWYVYMQGVVGIQDGTIAMERKVFEKAIAFEPEYQYYYRMLANKLQPKWGGSEGDAAAFAAEAADRLGGKKGDMIYYQIGSYLNCACDNANLLNGMSWPRIKRGYAALEETYGVSLQNLNKMAMMAAMAGDPEYAEEALTRIGESWDPETWRTRKYFDDTREWVKGYSGVKSIEGALKTADANLSTAEGRKFNGEVGNAFATNYTGTVSDCLKKSGDSFLIPFDLLIRLGKTGAVEEIFSTIQTHVSICLVPQLQNGQFPSPPQPSYWVKVHLQPSVDEIRKTKAENAAR